MREMNNNLLRVVYNTNFDNQDIAYYNLVKAFDSKGVIEKDLISEVYDSDIASLEHDDRYRTLSDFQNFLLNLSESLKKEGYCMISVEEFNDALLEVNEVSSFFDKLSIIGNTVVSNERGRKMNFFKKFFQ